MQSTIWIVHSELWNVSDMCWGEEDEEKTVSPQLGSGCLFIEKRNTCPDKTRIIHNVQLRVRYQNKESENKEKKFLFLQ